MGAFNRIEDLLYDVRIGVGLYGFGRAVGKCKTRRRAEQWCETVFDAIRISDNVTYFGNDSQIFWQGVDLMIGPKID